MIKEFRLPELGENIESGDIVQVLVHPGDTVQKDQTILEIETDKATIEVPSPFSGTIKDVLVKAGDVAEVGQLILTVETGNGAEVEEAQETGRNQKDMIQEDETAIPVQEATETVQPAVAASGTGTAQAVAAPETARVMEFRLPELGENIEGGDIVQVLVQKGDHVHKDQVVLEIETDKATVEVPSPLEGRVKDVHVKAGEHAEVGQLILTVEAVPEKESGPRAPQPEPAESQKEVTTEAQAPVADSRTETAPAARMPQPPRPEPKAAAPPRKLVPASPAVRRFAREIGIDITQVPGTGPGGRITIEDVKRYSRDLRAAKAEPRAAVVPFKPEPLPDFSKWGPVKKESMSNIRKATSQRMAQAWLTVPHVTQFDKADITELERLRKDFSPKAEALGGKLTITAILLKIAAAALKVFPKFNASIDPENNEIIFKNYYHIGVAVDTDRGLLVPVIRDVDKKNIIELSVELAQAAEKARNRQLSLNEMQGGTFTITNLGGIGGTNFTPIVNWPEVAILGVARGRYEPVYLNGTFEPRLMLPLAVSYDHRLIDGADAARFLRWIVTALEQPFMIALEG